MFGGKAQRTRLKEVQVEGLYQKQTEVTCQIPEAFHFDDFELRDGQLYQKGKSMPLVIRGGKLESICVIAEILGKERLCELGFDMPGGKLTTRQAVMLNGVEEELPSMSDVARGDDINLQEITKNAVRSTENLIVQLEGESSEDLAMHDLLGLDRQLRSIRGSLKVEVATKVKLEERIKKEKRNLEEIWDNPEYNNGIREDIRKRITKLNDDLSVRQESIDLLKGRLIDQITSFKETITKVLDKNTSLDEKIWMLFREQGITIASILTAIGMTIGVLVEALLPGGGGTLAGGKPPPKDEKGLKEWIKNKLKALASLLGRLGVKAAEVLPGIIGAILSWILNKAADVAG